MNGNTMESIDDYQVLNLIGRGGFASVYRAVCRRNGKEVAIKMVDKKQMNMSGMSGRVRQEVAIHSRLKHPVILELITFFEDQNFVYLVLELCEKGELGRYLKQSNTVFSEEEARTILQQVVSGLIYLHSHGIMHRDLTLANLMLTRDLKVKIGDFGLATQLGSAHERHVTMCGTPNFISPEVATRSSHGLEADIWGLGCLLYTLLVGTPPFDTSGVRSTLTKVVMGDYSLPEGLSPEVRDLIASMLRKNPVERIKLLDIPNHPWLRASESYHQDSGMYTMTTGFSAGNSIASTNRPGPRPLQAFPMMPVLEYCEENETHKSQGVHRSPITTQSEPVLGQSWSNQQPWSKPPSGPAYNRGDLHPSSPPVRMRTDPQDLPAPLLPLKSKISSLPSLPNTVREANRSGSSAYTNQLSAHRQQSVPLRSIDIEERSNYSEPCRPRTGEPNSWSHGSLQEIVSSKPPTSLQHREDWQFQQHQQQLLSDMQQPLADSRPHHQQQEQGSSWPQQQGQCNSRPQHQEQCNSRPQQQNYFSETCETKLPPCNNYSYENPISSGRHTSVESQAGHYSSNNRFENGQPSQRVSHCEQERVPGVERLQGSWQQTAGRLGHQQLPASEADRDRPSSAHRRIEDVVEPLSSARLRPTRQKTKNAVANILVNGEVCLEFIKTKRGEERVIDVMRISADGQRVVVYHPGRDGVKMGDCPTPIPSGGADALYSYSTLPEKLWKKYLYAARFISLVKAKTPKITLYTTKAKSYLMENSPADYEMYFYCGVKVSYSPDQSIKLIDLQGRIHTFSYPIVHSEVPSTCTLYTEHFQECFKHCTRIEKLLWAEGTSDPPVFPLIIGRKLNKEQIYRETADSSLDKENRAPPVNNLQSFKGSLMSTAVGYQRFPATSSSKDPMEQNHILTSSADPHLRSADQHQLQRGGGVGSFRDEQKVSMRSDLSRNLQITGVGVARLLPDGSVQIDYEDKTTLVVKTKSSALDYYQPNPGGGGGWETYTHSNLPAGVKVKLSLVPNILEQLMTLGVRGSER